MHHLKKELMHKKLKDYLGNLLDTKKNRYSEKISLCSFLYIIIIDGIFWGVSQNKNDPLQIIFIFRIPFLSHLRFQYSDIRLIFLDKIFLLKKLSDF